MKIVIVEDHVMMRELIRRVCVQECGHEVVGETEQGAAAIQLANRLKPDLVVLDLGLPDMDGLAVAATLSKNLPATRFLVITALLDDYTVHRVAKYGLHGFMDKSTSAVGQLRAALEAFAEGKNYFSPAFQAARQNLRADSNSFDKVLSNCEQEILSLVGEGLSDHEISRRIGISPTTSQTHRRKYLQKLNIKGTPKLTAFAISHGFARVPSRTPFPKAN